MMFSLIFFFLDVHKKPRHFNRLFRKEKNFVFFPKKLASHAGVFRGARFSKNACVGGYQKVDLEYIWEPRHFNRLFRQEKKFCVL